MSRTLLAQRLRLLERRGLLIREGATRGRAGRYVLNPSGESVSPIVWSHGHWAAEWMFGDLTPESATDRGCGGGSISWRSRRR
jgi:DNA-binding HxlR family transcriptional regulator